MKKKSMNRKMKWKKLLTGFLCMMFLASNAASALAENTNAGSLAVSGNDVSEPPIECEHEYHYIPHNEGTHTAACINCGLENEEDCIFVKNKEGGQVCEKCGFTEETEEEEPAETEETENEVQILSLEADGYDLSAADRTYAAGENITAYYYETDGVLVFEGTGEMTEWEASSDVPWAEQLINTVMVGEGIMSVGAYAFCGHTELTAVTFPQNLKEIGGYAFQESGLKEITIPDSVTEMGEYAFAGCSDAACLSIGSGISEIKEDTFSDLTKLETLTVPGNVKTIGVSAFRNTGAVEIIISDGVKTIGRSAFYLCEKAETITLGDSVELIDQMAFYQCKKLKSLAIPDSTESIGIEAFKNCNSLTGLTLGTGLKTIGNYAFEGARVLESMEIPDSVTRIGNGCFRDSRVLTDISIGKGLTEIGTMAFWVASTTETAVKTENNTAILYDWTGDRREVTFWSKTVFKDRIGNTLKELLLEHGDTVMDKAPAMEDYEDEGNTYVFTGWEPEITEETIVTGGAEYTPQYVTTAKKYMVTFKDYDGTVLKAVELAYGDSVSDKAPAASREADGDYVYVFTGWVPELEEDAVVTGEAEYTAGYELSEKTYTVTFQDYDGSTILQRSMKPGSLILPAAPVPEREGDKVTSYLFCGWLPELGETDELTEDVTYTAVYKKKVQTGILVSNEMNMPEGTIVTAADFKVSPIYEIYDGDNKLLEVIRDETDLIADEDILLSRNMIKRGSNTITIMQSSTRLMAKTDVFGCYIDGIAVLMAPEELEEGTELQELDVYYTYMIEDKAGEQLSWIWDITKKVTDYDLNDGDSVTITEGDNEIRVTEKETGNRYECTVYINGIPKPADGDDSDKKDDDVSGNTPSDGKEDDISGNDPSGDKEDDTAGKEDANGNDKSPGKEDTGKDAGSSTSSSHFDNTGDSPDDVLQDTETKNAEKETEPFIQTGHVPPVYGFSVLGVLGIMFMGSACLFEKRKRAGKRS